MYKLWVSTCCFVICFLLINITPPSLCAATPPTTTTTTTTPKHWQDPHSGQQQQQHQKAESHVESYQVSNKDNANLYTSSRNKRELSDGFESMNTMAKRLRSFVGKRNLADEVPFDQTDLQQESENLGYPQIPQLKVYLDDSDGQLYFGYPEDESAGDDEDDNFYGDIAKRIRTFVGKRSYADINSDTWVPEDDNDENFDLTKRLRTFVGKRLRSFVGKRDGFDKRLRSFVGKRIRTFVGKRDGEYGMGNERIQEGKRPRSFIGKRPRVFIGKRIRSFVGKRSDGFDDTESREPFDGHDSTDNIFSYLPDKRLRSFVGKRDFTSSSNGLEEEPATYNFDDGFGISADKRPRHFVGKRDFGDLIETNKRLRSFVGKRADKRLRSFVGKRSSSYPAFAQFPSSMYSDLSYEVPSVPSKRLRSFVGKRSDLDSSEVESPLISKRLRSFVGKRDSEMAKRLRSFVGRR